MIDPLFWLGFSLLLVSFSLVAVLIVAIPTLQEVARAARSADQLFNTLNQEFPPTLEAIRLTGMEVSELTDEINQGIEGATGVVKQVDRGLINAKEQVLQAGTNSRSLVRGVKTAWRVWRNPQHKKSLNSPPSNQNFDNPQGE